MFGSLRSAGFDIEMISHAEAILRHDMGTASEEIERILLDLSVTVEELVRGGGGEAQITQRIRRAFAELDWNKHEFVIQRVIDGVQKESTSHEIDHVKKFAGNTFALELEWNNKDPFFDRDLENFKRLHADGAISVGCIITRGRSLHEGTEGLIERFAISRSIQSIEALQPYYTPTLRQAGNITRSVERLGTFPKGWAASFCGDKFGESTTHWGKLQDRVRRGVGNPCPLLLIGIPLSVVTEE
ncbi:MAG: restriction endonuclease [Phycisphaeraceae bacterium]|nr:restriction endonuclease [Phycisphaeraceae bacterium]